MSSLGDQVRLIASLTLLTSGLARAQPSPPLPTVLDAPSLVREVLARNPSLGAARAAVKEAQAGVTQAGALEDPRLSYTVAPLSLFDDSVPAGHQVRVEQMLPFFGKRGLAQEVAQSEVSAAGADAEQVRQALALEAVKLADAWFVVHRSLEINREHVALVRALEHSAEAEYTTGQASQQDPLQAEVELTHLEHQAMVLASDREVLRAQINGLLHRALDAQVPPPPATLEVPQASPEGDLFEQAVKQRPELAAVRARKGSAQSALARVERDRWPDLTVMGEYNSMWMETPHQWMLGVGINIPVPWDKRHGEAEEARAKTERIGFEEQRLLDAIRTEVETSRLRFEEARHVATLYQGRLVPVAKDQVAAARAGFVVGKVPFTTLIDAERNLRTVQLASVQSLAEVDLRHAELSRALGNDPSGVQR